jgi:hypothetical protein
MIYQLHTLLTINVLSRVEKPVGLDLTCKLLLHQSFMQKSLHHHV